MIGQENEFRKVVMVGVIED